MDDSLVDQFQLTLNIIVSLFVDRTIQLILKHNDFYAGYFMRAYKRLDIAERLKKVPIAFFIFVIIAFIFAWCIPAGRKSQKQRNKLDPASPQKKQSFFRGYSSNSA